MFNLSKIISITTAAYYLNYSGNAQGFLEMTKKNSKLFFLNLCGKQPQVVYFVPKDTIYTCNFEKVCAGRCRVKDKSYKILHFVNKPKNSLNKIKFNRVVIF